MSSSSEHALCAENVLGHITAGGAIPHLIGAPFPQGTVCQTLKEGCTQSDCQLQIRAVVSHNQRIWKPLAAIACCHKGQRDCLTIPS